MKKNLKSYLDALSPEQTEKVEKRASEMIAEEMGLQELRKAVLQSQQNLAELLNVKQSEISKIEHRTDIYISTLRSYIEGLGGTLEITATFPDRGPVKITQFQLGAEEKKLLSA